MSAKSDDCGVGVSKAAWEDCSRYDHCDRRTKWVTPPRAYSAPSVPIARPPLAAPERAYLISESFEDVESPSTDKIAANDSLNVQCPHCGKLVTTTKTIDNCNRNHINSTESSLPLVQLTEACGRRVFFVVESGSSGNWILCFMGTCICFPCIACCLFSDECCNCFADTSHSCPHCNSYIGVNDIDDYILTNWRE